MDDLAYPRSLGRRLRRQAKRFDLVYVSQLRYEAHAALWRARQMPVVLRADRVGRSGDCLWQLDAPCGRRIKRRCMGAAGFVGPTRAAQRELEAAGYPRAKIVYLADGVAIPPPRTPQAQAAARACGPKPIRRCNCPPRPVWPWPSATLPWAPSWTACWPPGGRWPTACWRRGCGWSVPATDRDAVRRHIERLHLAGRVVAAGAFDQLGELLAAADLLVASAHEGAHVTLLEAMAAGLPVVAAATAANRSVLTDAQEGLLVAADEPAALSAAIARLCREPELAARLGRAARARAEAEFSLASMADQHVTWFQQLCSDRESSRSSPRSTAQGPKSN